MVRSTSARTSTRQDATPSAAMALRNRRWTLAHANGFALTTSRELGTARSRRPHSARTAGVTLASALKQPKVTYPAARHGARATGGASGCGV